MLSPRVHPFPASLPLLALRVLVGVAFVFHGWPKIQAPTEWMPAAAGYPEYALALAAFAEFCGGAALALGLITPAAAVALLCVMGGALYHHLSRGDPFVDPGGPSFELAATYFVVALLFLTYGPGRVSLDAWLFRRRE